MQRGIFTKGNTKGFFYKGKYKGWIFTKGNTKENFVQREYKGKFVQMEIQREIFTKGNTKGDFYKKSNFENFKNFRKLSGFYQKFPALDHNKPP